MEKGRTHYAIKNSLYSSVAQLISLTIKFLMQTIFIRTLGATYLGINGLFTNVLTVLSFAELGIGSVIVYSLYRPVAENDIPLINGYMDFYKKAYRIIGSMVAVLGLILLPFIPYLIHGKVISHIYIIYLCYLTNSVSSYFLNYKRGILTASQKDYVNIINQVSFQIIQFIIQFLVLVYLKNFILYLVVQILCTVTSNITITKKINKIFPFLLLNNSEPLDDEKIKKLKGNILEIFGSRVGGIVLNSTDNIIISSFIGVIFVGKYSNYALVATGIQSLLNKLVSATTPSIGNFIINGDIESVEKLLKKHFFINYTLAVFSATLLIVNFQPFVAIWAGKSYLLSFLTVVILVANFYLYQVRQTATTFLFAFGIFRFQGIKSIIEALTNIFISIVLIKLGWGINGVLTGTLLTTILISSWWENRQIFHYGFKKSVKSFLIKQYLFIILGVLIIGMVYTITSFVLIGGLTGIIVRSIIAILILCILFTGLFWRNEEFNYLMYLIYRILKSVKK